MRIALAEKGLDYQLRDLPWTRAALWGEKPEALLRANPRGLVPVLVDGELAIPDSTVIGEYLEERYPQVPLLPKDPVERAIARGIEDDADQAMADALTVLIREVFRKTDGDVRDDAEIADAMADIRATYARFEGRLDGREYLGGQFSVADIAALLLVLFASSLGCPPDANSRVEHWMSRVSARPSVAPELGAIAAAAAAA